MCAKIFSVSISERVKVESDKINSERKLKKEFKKKRSNIHSSSIVFQLVSEKKLSKGNNTFCSQDTT
jgi:hypothetical protein